MAHFKTQRRFYTPVRQLTVAISVACILFLVTKERPVLERTVSTLYTTPTSETRPATQVIHVSDVTAVRTTKPCLRYIFYDKPVKTGSTAVTEALEKYFDSLSEPVAQCANMTDCTRVAQEICVRKLPRAHLIQHVLLNESTVDCLRDKGFYHVTSIREPEERVISAWKFSRSQKSNHYGIDYNAPFEEFLTKFPRCALYKYYDDLTAYCTKEDALRRAEEIASRFDEVIDLSDHVVSDVHRRIQPYVKQVNVAPSGRARTGEKEVPYEVVELEYLLYNKLREKRVSLVEQPKNKLCER